MPYIVSGGRFEYRATISRKEHGRKNAGEPGRRLNKAGDYHFTKGWRSVPARGAGITLLVVPPGPMAAGTHAPRIYGPVAPAYSHGGQGTPNVSAFMPRDGDQARAVRRVMGKAFRKAALANAKAGAP